MRGQCRGNSRCSIASVSSFTGKMRPLPRTGTPLVRASSSCGAGDTGSPRSHRLIEPFAVPPFRVIPGEVKRQLGCAARGFAKTVCTHEQAFTVLGAGFMKGGLLGIWAIVRKL